MKRLVTILILLAAAWFWQHPPTVLLDSLPGTQTTQMAGSVPAFLPTEARETLAKIQRGGPYPYRQDGSEFQNREGRLPAAARGTYREYTVRTPGARDRGARRIITAGIPPAAYWYTDDHYRSFRRFEVSR